VRAAAGAIATTSVAEAADPAAAGSQMLTRSSGNAPDGCSINAGLVSLYKKYTEVGTPVME